MALFAEQVPEGDRKSLVAEIVKPDGRRATGESLVEFEFRRPRFRQPGQIALDVRQEHRNAGIRKTFGKDLQSDGFSRARRTGYQPVAVGVFENQVLVLPIAGTAAANEQTIDFRHIHSSPCTLISIMTKNRALTRIRANFVRRWFDKC